MQVVYEVKLKSDGSVERCKARLVAKGYTQEFGIQYHEVFSPDVNLVTVKVFIALATAFSWPIHQLDINNALLHGFLNGDIYMTIPQGFKDPTGASLKITKESLWPQTSFKGMEHIIH